MLQKLKQHTLTKQTVALQRHRCSVGSVSHTILFALPTEYCIHFAFQKHAAALSTEYALEFLHDMWAAKRLKRGLAGVGRPHSGLIITPSCVSLEVGEEKKKKKNGPRKHKD